VGLCQLPANLLIQNIADCEGADDFAAAFEEISDLRHRVAAVIKGDDEADVAIFAHHHGFVAVFKGALLLGLAPKDFVVAVGIEGRVNVNQINLSVRQLGELFQIVTAINDAGVEEGGRTTRLALTRPADTLSHRTGEGRGEGFHHSLFCHERRLEKRSGGVNSRAP